METQTNATSWLDKEIENTQTSEFTGERLPTLKLEVGKIVSFTIDFSQPFQKWTGGSPLVTKAILPAIHKGEKKNIWLNVKNPLYGEICKRGKAGQTNFKISTTGTQKDTRYTIVEEE